MRDRPESSGKEQRLLRHARREGLVIRQLVLVARVTRQRRVQAAVCVELVVDLADEQLDTLAKTNAEDTGMVTELMKNLRSPFYRVGPPSTWEARARTCG